MIPQICCCRGQEAKILPCVPVHARVRVVVAVFERAFQFYHVNSRYTARHLRSRTWPCWPRFSQPASKKVCPDSPDCQDLISKPHIRVQA